MPLHIDTTDDIFEYANKVDAMVVPANKRPIVGCGLDSKMFMAAGFDEVMRQRVAMGNLHIGQAKETDGFRLAKYLIHTATPIWLGGTSDECQKLKNCYINSIKCADRLGLKSIAFPLLSAGNMKFPRGTAVETALEAIDERLNIHDSLDVYLVKRLSDECKEAEKGLYLYENRDTPMEILLDKQKILDAEGPNEEAVYYYTLVTRQIEIKAAKEAQEKNTEKELSKYLAENPNGDITEYKRERFYKYFETCGKSAAELARLVNCDKSTLSRIKSGKTKAPNKGTIVALSVAMELSAEERYDFINCSGYSYPVYDVDFRIEQYLHNGYKTIRAINEAIWVITNEYLVAYDGGENIYEII